MRTYNLLNKKIKLGLVTCGLYAATSLAIPAFASHVEKPAMQPLNLGQITTSEQAEIIYNQKLVEYASDKKINSGEIKGLVDTIETIQSFLYQKSEGMEFKLQNLKNPPDLNLKRLKIKDEIYKLKTFGGFPKWKETREIKGMIHELVISNPYSVKVETLENMITNLASKKVYKSPLLEKIKEDFKNQILSYFPLLLEKPLFYSSSEPVERKLNPVMKNLVKRADEFLKKHYKDTRLELLVEKETYAVKDVLRCYNFIHEKRNDVCFNLEEINQEKLKLEAELKILKSDEKHYLKNRDLKITNLKEKLKSTEAEELQYKNGKKLKIADLEKKLKVLENERQKRIADNNIQIQNLREKISNISSQILKLKTAKSYLNPYLQRQGSINKFINMYDDLSKYWSFSAYSCDSGFLKHANLEDSARDFEVFNNQAIINLKNYLLRNDGFDVEVEALKNPAKTMFPWPWWINAIFGCAFPVFRNIIAAKLIKRKVDLFDITEGVFESLLFPLVLDGVFPLMYPLRVFGTSILFEPIRKFTGWRDVK